MLESLYSSSVRYLSSVASYAVNLSGNGNIGLVIPDKLQILATKMEHYAFKIRQKSKELHADKDKHVKTQLRQDNMSESLVLGIS